ncbi:MAG: hypothetical protein Q7S92_06490 [Candidatus Diapherotrites archaeon]|nr:hypothetical protein [Candidatus Diapherotrites archaeon]
MKSQVEVIPWAHILEDRSHRAVINYVQRLPKGSVVAIEKEPQELDLFYQAFDKIIAAKEKATQGASGDLNQLKKTITSDNWAFIELIHDCQTRGIQVIPIESMVGYTKAEKALRILASAPDYRRDQKIQGLKAFIKADEFRELQMAREIAGQIRIRSPKKIHVIIGEGHVTGLHEQLTKIGLTARINLSLFPNPKPIQDGIKLEKEIRNAIRQEKYMRALNLYEASIVPRSAVEIRSEHIINAITARRKKEQTRIERKKRQSAQRTTRRKRII